MNNTKEAIDNNCEDQRKKENNMSVFPTNASSMRKTHKMVMKPTTPKEVKNMSLTLTGIIRSQFQKNPSFTNFSWKFKRRQRQQDISSIFLPSKGKKLAKTKVYDNIHVQDFISLPPGPEKTLVNNGDDVNKNATSDLHVNNPGNDECPASWCSLMFDLISVPMEYITSREVDIISKLGKMFMDHATGVLSTQRARKPFQYSNKCDCWKVMNHLLMFGASLVRFAMSSVEIFADLTDDNYNTKWSTCQLDSLLKARFYACISYFYTFQFDKETKGFEVCLDEDVVVVHLSKTWQSWISHAMLGNLPEGGVFCSALFSIESHVENLLELSKGEIAIVAMFCLLKLTDMSSTPLSKQSLPSLEVYTKSLQTFKAVCLLLKQFCVYKFGFNLGIIRYQSLCELFKRSQTHDEALHITLCRLFTEKDFEPLFQMVNEEILFFPLLNL